MATTSRSSTKKTKKPSKNIKSTSKISSVRSKLRRPNFTFKGLRKYLVPFLVALLIALVGIFWYYKIYTDPQKIFWGSIENNLSTRGYSKESSQESGSFVSKEVNQVIFSPKLGVVSVRDITDGTQQPPTRIKLEALGTPMTDYQHYALIDRPAASGKAKPDYARVYGMWLKSEEDGAQLINSNLFGPLLFGDLSEPLKKVVVAGLRKAYVVNYASVQKLNLDGRRTYSFDVEVVLSHYASAAQKYARGLGLPIADQIDPKSYSPEDKTRITLFIDALSRQIRKVQFQTGNNFESYTGYGIGKEIVPPTKTVSSEEFQNAINSVSQ